MQEVAYPTLAPSKSPKNTRICLLRDVFRSMCNGVGFTCHLLLIHGERHFLFYIYICIYISLIFSSETQKTKTERDVKEKNNPDTWY